MNYSEMTTFEINEKVSMLMAAKSDCRYVVIEDYCNSWADAGPIIQENGIVVACYQRMEPQAWPAMEGTISASHSRNKNPLRAAMECFLKMKEAENVYA